MGVFDNCDNNAGGVITVNGNTGSDYDNLGGILDLIDTTITMTGCDNKAAINYNNTGTTNPYKTHLGGLVGQVLGKPKGITNCTNSGKITMSDPLKYIGGCFGHIDVAADLSLWTNITNSGDIEWPTGSSHVPYIGGVAGLIEGSATGVIKQWHNSGDIHVATAATTASNLRTFVGGIVALSCVDTYSYCSNTGDVLAPYARRTTASKADLTSWVGLITGKRYYHTGADGSSETATLSTADNCLVKGTIKRYKTDKSGVDECVVDTVEEVYKYAFAEPASMEGDEDPTLYMTNISVTTMPVEPSTEDTTTEE